MAEKIGTCAENEGGQRRQFNRFRNAMHWASGFLRGQLNLKSSGNSCDSPVLFRRVDFE